jgi:hypothetical protein
VTDPQIFWICNFTRLEDFSMCRGYLCSIILKASMSARYQKVLHHCLFFSKIREKAAENCNVIHFFERLRRKCAFRGNYLNLDLLYLNT